MYSEEFKLWVSLQYGLPFKVIETTVNVSLIDQLYNVHQKIRNELSFLVVKPVLQLEKFTHVKTGNPYTLMCIANSTAEKKEYVETAVYIDHAQNIFSRPNAEFNEKFKKTT